MSEQTWHYIDTAGAQQGPIDTTLLRSLIASNIITASTPLWSITFGEQWIPAGNIEALFPVSAAIASPPPAYASPPATRALVTSDPVTTRALESIVSSPKPTAQLPPPQLTKQLAHNTVEPSSTPVLHNQVNHAEAEFQQQFTEPEQNHTTDQSSAISPQQTVPQQESGNIYPATITKGGNMALCYVLIFGGIFSILLGSTILGISFNDLTVKGDGPPLYMGLIIFGIGCLCILSTFALPFIYVYRAWKCLQPGGASMTPDHAVKYLFIPFYNIYWSFKAVGGLPKEWNRIVSSYRNTRYGPRLTVGAYVCMLIIPAIGYIIWLNQITKALNFMVAIYKQQSNSIENVIAHQVSHKNG